MNINSAAALIHRGDLAKRHLEAVAAAVLESQRPTTRKVYSGAWSRFPGLGAQGGSHVASRRPGHGGRLSGSPRRSGVVVFFARHGLQGDQLLPSPHRTADTHSFGRRQDDPGRGEEPFRQARNGRAEAGPEGLREEGLRAIIDTAHIPRVYQSGRTESSQAARWRGKVDIAIVSIMRDALLRRCEAANLRWADVKFRRDGSSRVTHPALEDIQHARRPVRGCAGDGSAEPHPPEEAVSESPGVRCSARQDHLRPDRRGVQGGGTR